MTEVGSVLENLSRHERALLFERLRQKREQQDRSAERIGRRAPGTAPVPLSFAQQRLWFLDRLEPGNAAYNIPWVMRLTGPLDPAALHQALLGVAARHESLRTTFGQVGDGPVQVIAPRPDIPMPWADLSALGEGAETEAIRLCAERSRAPFDLARGPLVRTLLVRLGPEEHILLLVMHHVVSDGWSMGILMRETALLYGALAAGAAGETPVLPPLPIQYADFALWQREWLQGERLEKQLAWWRQRLEPLPEPLQLPTDRPRPLQRSSRGDHLPFRIPAGVTAGLRELARQKGGTLFVGLLAGFQALLQRYTGQDDLTVGTPVANRNRAETADLIGFFVNTLALRGDLSGDPAFRDFLGRLREVTVNAFAHQDLPFERLVEELRPDRDPSRTPLFEVMLSLQNTPAPALAEGGLRLEMLEFEPGTAQFDLQLLTVEAQGEVAGVIEYSTDLFDRATILRCARHLEALFAGAVEDPGRRLSQLPLLGAGERQQAVLEWNDTGALFPEDGGLHGLVEAQVDRTPDAVAVTFEGEALTYRELDRAANRLARRLRRLGAGPDSRVAVCLDRSLEMVVSVLAVLKAGAAWVPVDPGSPPERLAAMLEDSGAGLVVTLRRHVEAIPGGPGLVVLDGSLSEESSERLGVDPGPDAASYVIYTSGSTGRPKGVVNTHRGIRNRLLWIQAARGLTPADRVLQKTPFTFDVSVWEFFWTLMAGARLMIARPGGHRDPGYLVRLIAGEEVTVVHFVPSMLQAFLEEPDLASRIPTVRQMILGGEALTPELRQRALDRLPPHVELFNQYGPTEAAIEVTAWDVRQDTGMRVPIGRPVANTRIHLLDRSLRPVPLGVAGELYVGGPQLARGYEGRPDLTAERFVPDPIGERPGGRLYRTGDLARRLPDGAVEYLGRLDFQVKIRGFRIELGEIEAVLASMPGVREAAVLAPEVRPGERRLAAFLVPEEGAPDLATVRDLLRRKVPEPMVPSSWTVLPALPLNASGKLDRRALAALPQDGAAPASREEIAGPPLRTPVEELLAGIWSEVLVLDPAERPLSPRDHFFELGGHSLLATRLVSRLRETFGVDLPLSEVFARPALEDLARRIEQERAAEGTAAAAEIRPASRDRDLPLSFAQERLWFLDRLEPGRSIYNMPIALVARGGLDPAALEAGLREVVRRHENLRTTFAECEGRPVQVIAPPAPWTLPRIDLSGLPADAARAEARRLAGEDAARPFDLARGPLLRGTLLVLGPEEHVLLLDMHHIVSDGWSLGLLVGEITALYRAAVRGEPSPLPELPVQYADFAVWQRDWLQEEALDRQLDYWKGRLADAPASLDLPTDRPRPPVQSFRGATIPFSFGPELTRDLRALGRRQGATLFMTLLAAFLVLLRRITGQDDLVVGSPIAGRNHLATEPLIGFFVNSLVLRLDAAGDPGFSELLARVRGVALDAYAHQDLPFERLVEELRPERLLSHNPLFQVMFALQNAPVRPVELPGLSLAPLDFEIPYAKFDLGPTFQEVGESLAAGIDYAADLFDPATIRRMAGQLETVLAGVVADPGRRVSELPLLARAEQHQLLAEWNDTEPDRPAEDVLARFEAQAARTPEALAVEAGGESLTYAELNDRVDRLALHLRSLGVGLGTVVGLCLDRTLDLPVGLLAIWKAGGAYLPLDPALPQARLAFLLEDSGAELVVGHEATVSVLETLDEPLAWDRRRPAGFLLGLSGWRDAGGPRQVALSYMIYTSGTTGQPKAVMVERGHLAATLDAVRGFFEPGDRMPCLAPFSFDIFLFELLGPLLAGGTSILVPLKPALDVDRLAAGLNTATLLHAVPALMRQIVDRIPDGRRTALRGFFVGGDVVPAELLADLRAAFPQAWVRVLYGPTEATIICTAHEVGDDARSLLGRPLAGATLVLRNRDGAPVPVGVPGEIWIGGAGVTRGYWQRDELTAEKFVERDGQRFFRTGDLARLLPDGNFEFLGRIDSQVKVRGFRIELGEVESALARHPGVREAVAMAREDDPTGKRLVAYVVPRPAPEIDPTEAAGHVRQWQGLYEETYGRSGAADPRFNLEGWNSSYTGLPIPEAEMREWVETTVAQILALKPRRVLEIGCGTGLLLYRIAPHVERYVATDFSQTALDAIGREVERSTDLGTVELLQRTADDWSGIEPGEFDLVILNSVVQYFPSAEYLRRVLESAAVTASTVFLGDVRNLALLEELHASVEHFRNPDLPEEDLQSRVRRRVAEEEELLLDPQLFAVLPGRLPGLQSAEVLPKQGQFVNELTRFRYDVILRSGETEEPAGDLDWTDYANDPLKVRSARALVVDMRRSLQAELPEYMVPSAFVVLDELPLTSHGKVDRAALPAPESALPAGSYVAPRTPAEEALAAIWAEVLGLERVGIADNFFELGGHSLLATQVVSQVRERLGAELPVRALFEHPTVAGLALQLEDDGDPKPSGERIVPRPAGMDVLPLSFAQQRLWFLDRLEPGNAAYNIASPVRITGPLDAGALHRALEAVVARHESLRTTFREEGSGPVQVVGPRRPFDMPVVDLTSAGGGEASLRRLATEEARRPFDLAAGPLVRATLLRLGPESHVLMLAMHHVVSDGWSMGVLVRETAALYEAFMAGAPARLAELPVQYGDFALWQRKWLAGERLEAQIAWWRERLAGLPDGLDLPADRPRPPLRSSRGGQMPFSLDAGLGGRLQDLARQEGATLFMVLLAGFQALLQRYTGQEDLAVGTPIANRNRAEVTGVIGFFVNTLVLRGDLAGDPPFRVLVTRLREMTLGAYDHQDLPFERLVEELRPERDPSRTPLFQALFALQNTPVPDLDAGGLRLSGIGYDRGAAQFDLSLFLQESPDGTLAGSLEYGADLFDPATVARMARHFEVLLQGAAAAPEIQLSRLPLLTGAELHQSAVEWNDTALPRTAASVVDLFRAQAARTPDALAVDAGEESITYAGLDRLSDRAARRLLRLGVGPETVVGVLAERSAGLVVALLGILKAGGAYLPLDPGSPAERLAFLLADAGTPLLLCDRGLAADLPVARTVCLEDLVAGEDDGPQALPAVPAGFLAYVTYTSGSTGRPKGVAVTHRNVVRLLRGGYADLGQTFLQLTTVSFDPSVMETWGPLVHGGRVAPFPGRRPTVEEISAAIARHQVTSLWLSAGLFHQMAEHGLAGLRPLSQLLAGGDVLSPSHVKRTLEELPGLTLVNGYGPTEVTTFTTCHVMRRPEDAVTPLGTVPIGRPIGETRVHLLDRGLRQVPVGGVGELYAGGEGVARGYLGQPDLTAERFLPDPFGAEPGARLYRTGDLARYLPDGRIEFLGRTDGQVKIRGFRIELGEIEAALAEHPEVAQALVLAQEAAGGKRLAAFVVPRRGSDEAALAERLKRHLRQRLPEPMVPAVWTLLQALPLTAHGKVDRAALPAPESARPALSYTAPRTPAEETLAAVWAEILGLERVGAGDNFFELGGHSLLATSLVSRLRETFGVDLPLHEVFALPTLEDLARRIEQERAAGGAVTAPEIRPAPRDRDLPLSFAQERLWFLDRLEPGRAVYNMPIALVARGGLDPASLEAALGEVVRRHENLRTTFTEREGRPVQIVTPPAPWTRPRIDLSGLPADAAHAEARRLAGEDAARPFDLARGPLLRGTLLILGPEEHVLLLDMHHIVSDGWSLGILVNEITALYGAAVRGEPSPLPELPVQYADFAVWQREWLQEEALDRQLAYWKDRLADAPASLDLPTDRPRPPVQSFRGATLPFAFGPELTRDLRALGRRQGATLFMTLLAAFLVLLRRITGQDDLVVGSPIAGRNQLATEPLIGFFVNSLVLRLDAAGDPPFADLLVRVRSTALDAYAHQDLPFERLVEELRPERQLSHNPLFQVMFALQNAPVRPVDLLGLSLAPLDFELPFAKFDLGPTFQEAGESLAAALDYAADLFDPATIRRMAGHLETVLTAVVANPGRRVSELPLLARSEQHQLLAEWNDTSPLGEPEDVLARFEAQAASSPEAPAVEAGGAVLTYAELNRRADLLAQHLRSLGVGPGTVVGLCLERTLDLPVGLLAIWKAGGAYVPLDSALPQARLTYLLEDSKAALVIGHEATLPILETLDEPLAWDRRRPAGFLLGLSGRRDAGGPRRVALSYLIYTSGTTGQPKAVMVERGHLASTLEASRGFFRPGDRMPCLAPFSFDIFLFELLGTLLAGGTSVLVPLKPALDVDRLAADLETATLLHAVPALMRQIVDRIPDGSRTALRGFFVGGDVVPAELLADLRAAFPQAWVRVLYGPTEATIICTAHEVGAEARSLLGRPLAGATLILRDQDGAPVPVGVPGEIWIGGAGVTRGYWQRDELTAEKFVERDGQRFFRTGDLARLLPDGNLEFLGRIDNQVKVRGFRIELGEVESALARHPGVREAVAVAREDDPAGKRLVAYVVPRPAPETDPAEAAGHVRQWQGLYEETYGRSGAADPRFNLEGWNSSYTGLPIPEAEMREWVDTTVARILALKPRRVLEIGCGTGLLLYRIAPHVERYVGTDFSSTALDAIRREINRSTDLRTVELLQRTADDWGGIEPGEFDLVILNSVIQYFPGVDYLRRVLESAVTTAGTVFLGDVRNLALLEELHASVERFRNPDLPEEDLQSRVRRRVAEEEELLLDPRLFAVLPGSMTGLQSAEVLPKQGQFVNELTRFRYDVVLRTGETEAPRDLDWTGYANDPLKVRSARSLAADLRRSLQAELPEYMVPSAFVVLDALPLTAHGKVDRAALPAPESARPAGSYTAPRTPAEEALAAIWAEVLGLERVGAEDNFFELGGHSLLATQVVSQVRERMGAELPVRALFEHPTIAGLAPEVGSAGLAASIAGLAPAQRKRAREAPLSFSQERLWFLDRLMPGSSAYNIPGPLRLTGPLDAGALERCFAELSRRQESLRTRFTDRGGVPVQAIDPPLLRPLPRVDLSALPIEAGRREAERLTAAEALWPFDLERGPLFRPILLRLAPEEHVLLLTIHHIVSDGWSMGVLFRELLALYEAFAAGLPSPLPELPLQYADFSVWQRETLSGPDLQEQLGYWRERLAGHPPALELPLDHPRPPVQTFRGASVAVEVPAEVSARLRSLSLAESASPFMALLAGFKLLLARLARQEDVLVGSPIAGRSRAELEGLIGFFLNTLVLRTDVSGNPAFRELVRRVRETALGAYGHQDVPFERLLEELQPERDLSRTPLFQVFFNMLNFPRSRTELPGGIGVEPLGWGDAEAKFDITVYAMEGAEGGFFFNLVYNADLFDRPRMEELARQYAFVLAQVADRPDEPIGTVSLRTAEAATVLPDPRELLGSEWIGAVHDLFLARARRHPERIAVEDAEVAWTYGELAERVERLAAALQEAGVVKGDQVAIYAHRSAPVAWAVLATLRAGGVFVMLDPAYPAPRLAEMLRLAQPRAFIALAAAGEVPARMPALPGITLPCDLSSLPEQAEPVEVGPDDIAYIAFTSGSTGVPKGILGRHGPLSHFLPWQCQRFDLTEEDRYSLLSGLAHDPLQRDLFTPLCTGGSVVVPTLEDIATPGRLATWMAKRKVTVAHLTPAMGQILTEAGATQAGSLRRILLVGDVLTRLDVERLHRIAPQAQVVNLYGSTETQRAVGYHAVDETDPSDPSNPSDRSDPPLSVLPLGRGMKDVQLLVVTPSGALAGVGEVGEIQVRSPHLAAGYLGDPELTREKFQDQRYRTGDLGRYLPNGEVAFAGRADLQVKIRGFRIELGEIEATLGRLPGVREAVVIARQDGPAAERRLVAYVVPDLQAQPAAEKLREGLRGQLPAYMVPAAFVLLDKLPVTPNNKVDRRALPAPEMQVESAAWVEPQSELEQTLAGIWAEVLGVEKVGVTQGFFDLGGHSLLLVRLHARLQEALGRELTLVELFNYPNVRALAEHLSRSAAPAAEPAAQPQDRARKQIEAARRQKELARTRRGDNRGEGN